MHRQLAIFAGVVLLIGCASRPVPDSVSAADQPGTQPQPSALVSKPANVTIPAGTRVRVRLVESLSTRRNQPGDKFTATLDRPIRSEICSTTEIETQYQFCGCLRLEVPAECVNTRRAYRTRNLGRNL